jgi:hypothetical protein
VRGEKVQGRDGWPLSRREKERRREEVETVEEDLRSEGGRDTGFEKHQSRYVKGTCPFQTLRDMKQLFVSKGLFKDVTRHQFETCPQHIMCLLYAEVGYLLF